MSSTSVHRLLRIFYCQLSHLTFKVKSCNPGVASSLPGLFSQLDETDYKPRSLDSFTTWLQGQTVTRLQTMVSLMCCPGDLVIRPDLRTKNCTYMYTHMSVLDVVKHVKP